MFKTNKILSPPLSEIRACLPRHLLLMYVRVYIFFANDNSEKLCGMRCIIVFLRKNSINSCNWLFWEYIWSRAIIKCIFEYFSMGNNCYGAWKIYLFIFLQKDIIIWIKWFSKDLVNFLLRKIDEITVH